MVWKHGIKKIMWLLCLLLIFLTKQLASIPLFERFQALEDTVPYVQLAQLPTPIHRCQNLESVLGHRSIFIKRDDLTGSIGLYGGNKVRKLEFLLGEALQRKAKKVITFGCVGSNHAVATACYAKQLGLDCLLMMKHQPNSPVVKQNLLLDNYFHATFALFADSEARNSALDVVMGSEQDLYFIPTGGSVPLGALGYVNAAFELKNQIQQGVIPEPNVVYVPIGSCGTTAGLLLGFVLADIHAKIVAVAVEPEVEADEFAQGVKELFFETNKLLHSITSSIPISEFPHELLFINKEFCGTEYGLWLASGNEAMQLMRAQEMITLEGTYSAKALAALIADIQKGVRKNNEVILLWNTYCGLDFSCITDQIDYRVLPQELHEYFEHR